MNGRKNKKIWVSLFAGMILLFLVVIFCIGCQKKSTEEERSVVEKVVTLRMIVLGNEPEKGMTELYTELDALTIPELGCVLRFEFIPWGNERKQLNIAAASGEYDLMPMGVFSDYLALVEKNAFLDLNEYLYLVPDMVEHYKYYDEEFLKNSETSGGLYGIPQYGSGALQYVSEGFFYREDLRKEWGLEKITDLETMEAYLYRAKEDSRYRDEALITDNRIWTCLWILLSEGKYLEVGTLLETPFAVVAAENPDVVLNRLETPEFQKVLEYLKKWKRDGILDNNMLALSDNEGERGRHLLLEDRKPCESNAPIWTVGNYVLDLTEHNPDWEFEFFLYITANEDRQYANRPVASSRISVSSKTKYPETAIKLLEKIHTDKRYYDLFLYGVEGIHYHLVDEKVSYAGVSSSNKFAVNVAGDGLLNYSSVPVNEQWGAVEDRVYAWEEKVGREAEISPLDGFVFVPTGLNQVMRDMEEARLLYFQPLVCGYYEEEGDIEEAVEELRRRGLDRYLESIQSALKEHMENQKGE